MENFLDQVLEKVYEEFQGDYRKLCIVFPTRRACLLFRHRLAAKHGKPVWAPGILGISDFVARHSSYRIAEETELLFELYNIYKKHWPEQDFDKYHSWGQMLLNDFDEVDKQLNDPSGIFSQIRELKKIDAAFLAEPESLQWIKDFISSFDENKMTDLQKKFASSWDKLKVMYVDFNHILDAKGIAYEGKAYRELVHLIRDKKFKPKWDHFVFAGFYGLSRAEEEIIYQLKKNYNTRLYWDADNYYFRNKIQEAGNYFRKSQLFEENSEWIGDHFKKSGKNITISGIPLQAGQAKYLGQLLEELTGKSQEEINRSAIILPDENMLFPVLYAIPEKIEFVNVTMGYPLKQSHYAELLKLLHDLQKRITRTQKGGFYFRHVIKLLSHPLISNLLTPVKVNEKENGQFHYLNTDQIKSLYGFEKAELLFAKVETIPDVFKYLYTLFELISSKISSGKAAHFEDQVLNFVVKELRRLEKLILEHKENLTTETVWQIIRESVASLKIPFTGEPVKGLQIMGFLETRALDFENVYILSVNEGILPASGDNRSFIPYSLRKGFGLSTYEDQDSTYAYHFYRILQRAKNIHLLYNTEVGKMAGGEPGRYLLQIRHELKPFMEENLQLTDRITSTPVIPELLKDIQVVKTEDVIDQLNNYLLKGGFSSSALTTYIHCQLQFYFRYLASIKEKDQLAESIEADIFGNILHDVMEIVYREKTGQTVYSSDFDQLIQKSEDAIKEAVLKNFHAQVHELEGYDIILVEVIRSLVKQILLNDQKEAPFAIQELEKEFLGTITVDEHKINLKGRFDRVDERNGITRIIDYKTGKVEIKLKPIPELFSNPDGKALFQLYFYSLIYDRNHQGSQILPGFYVARDLSGGITSAMKGAVISTEILAEFEKELQMMIKNIFDPGIKFIQTEDVKRCVFCEYRAICHR